MVSINWCLKMKNGIEIVEPSENMSVSYLKMAEESLGIIQKVDKSKIWTSSASYYVMYYCLYSIMMRIGVKCEIHKCSIGFMKKFLSSFYNLEDVKLIETAFGLRGDLQYYPDKLGDEKKLKRVREGAVDFFVKTKAIFVMVSERQINEIRQNLEENKK